MIKINKCTLEDYTFDEKNSSPGEQASREYPGHASELSLDIKSIMVEEKTILLKQLKVGTPIEFNIDQSISIPVPNFKLKEHEDINIDVKGEGNGEILEIKGFEDFTDDEEYQEVELILTKGYADRLAGV